MLPAHVLLRTPDPLAADRETLDRARPNVGKRAKAVTGGGTRVAPHDGGGQRERMAPGGEEHAAVCLSRRSERG